MKNLVKLINIHDGEEKEHHNGDRLYIESKPRAEMIIAAFLNDGWKLINATQRYNPSINQPGVYGFYLGGWEVLFTKSVEDDVVDNSDEIISNVLRELNCLEYDDDEDMDYEYPYGSLEDD